MKWRKKPVEIEAHKLLIDDQSHIDILKWININGGNATRIRPDGIRIETLEGPIIASIGDFVIKGVKGEFYSCKPDIFYMTHDRVDHA